MCRCTASADEVEGCDLRTRTLDLRVLKELGGVGLARLLRMGFHRSVIEGRLWLINSIAYPFLHTYKQLRISDVAG